MKGYIHSIETFGTVDGGGIRYVLFLQGCPLRCQFCQNPDTWSGPGREVEVEEIVRQVRDYKAYFDLSGGGITVSGGEPLAQWEFVQELFRRCGELGVHRILDTSGYAPPEHFRAVLEVTDRVLFCLKVVDREKHRALTGHDNDLILVNLGLACRGPAELVVRYVLLPEINDSDRDLEDLAHTARCTAQTSRIEILPYHRLGVPKWKALGWEYELEWVRVPTPADLDRARRILQAHGVEVE